MNYGSAVSQEGYDVKSAADRLLVYSSAFSNLKIYNTYSLSTTIPDGASANFTAATDDTITSSGHGLNNGDVVNFTTTGTLPGGLYEFSSGYYYYVIEKTTNTFKVSLTSSGSSIDITSTGSGTHTWYRDTNVIDINHNLGYLAPAIMIYNGSTTIGQTNSYLMSDSGAPFDFNISTNRTRILIPSAFDLGFSNPGDTIYFTVYQFLDTFDSYSNSTINTITTQGDVANDYGIRVSKEGFGVKTCDDIDCIFSSSFFSNIIHKKGTDTTGTITHNLGYIPSFLAYVKISGNDFLSSYPFGVATTTTTLESGVDVTGDTLYYIIFKSKSI